MSETYSVYNQNGTLANELARCRVVKISTGVYTWDIVGGSASSTSEESIVADDNYSIIRAEIPSSERAGVPIEWAVNSAKDFYIVAICEENIIDGLSDGAFSYDAEQKVLWLECPFENAKEWIAYIFRAEHPVNNFAIAEGRARISAIQAQFEKDNRILRQLDAQIFRTLRTCDPIKTLPPKEKLIGKVLAFGADGNPDLSLSKEDVKGAYLARDEAKELKNETETLKNQTAELKLDAESYKNYAIDAASKAVAAQGKAEEAQVAAEKAKAETGNIKSDVEATVSEFNATVNSKVQEVEGAAQSGITEVDAAKTDALGEIATSKTSAVSEVDAAKTEAVGEISAIKSEVETAGENAVSEVNVAKAEAKTEIAADLANAKNEIDAWSDQTERFAKNEADISALELGKANSGYLELNKGTVSSASVSLSLPLSFCAVLGADFANQISVGNFVLSLNSNRILTFSDGIKSISSSALTPATHVVCVAIGNDGSAKVFVDNPIAPNQSGSGFVLTTSMGCVLGTSADIGSLSNFRVFNFDMSADGAPCTVEDYMSGKPLKPGVLENRLFNADPNMGASTDGGWNNVAGTKGDWAFHKGTANYEGKHLVTVNLDETDAAEVGASYAVDFSTRENLNYAGARVRFLNNKIKLDGYEGKKIKVHISFYAKKLSAIGSLTVSYDRTAYNSKTIKAYSTSAFNSDIWTKIDDIIEFTVDSGTFKGKVVGIFAAEGTDTDVGAYRIANFKFEVLGTALLAFENYTFNGEVLDISGNANHATVTGDVKGTNDSSIEVLYQKIASRISNATVE